MACKDISETIVETLRQFHLYEISRIGKSIVMASWMGITRKWRKREIETAEEYVKNPPANAEDERHAGSIPGSGKSPWEGNGNPLWYSCPENPMDRGDLWATVHEVAKRWTWLSMHVHTDMNMYGIFFGLIKSSGIKILVIIALHSENIIIHHGLGMFHWMYRWHEVTK